MRIGLLQQSRRTAILFWVMAGLFIAQMTWWIFFQIKFSPDESKIQKEMNDQKRTLALYGWRDQIGRLTDSLSAAWDPLTVVSAASLETSRLRGYNAVHFFDSTGGHRLIARSNSATVPIGQIKIRVAGGVVSVLVDAQALENYLGHNHPDIEYERKPVADVPARDAVTLDQLKLGGGLFTGVLEDSGRRTRMFVGEGSFFVLLIIIGAIAIHRSLRRGAEFEQRQQNFLAAVTHELKAPLASIRLFTETLSSRQLPEEKRQECLGKIARDVERLQDLIDDALEAGVFASRSFHPALELNDLSGDLTAYAEMFRHRAERAGLRMSTEIAPDVKVRTDQVHLRRAISVVIENAIKYSAPKGKGGALEITLKTEGREAVITVRDEGIGLEPKDQDRAFERFYRAGNEMTRKVSGSGLGLYLAQEIIAAHKGTIKLHSDGPGTGAMVTIRLPLAE